MTRLEGFSDAVFAIALALLVVSLEVPKDIEKLAALARGFIPFSLMFAMVCYIWYEHNVFFRRFGLQDQWTVFLNCVLLFVVLFYVYPLKFLTTLLLGGLFRLENVPTIETVGQMSTLMLLYSGGVVLVFGTLALLYRHAQSLSRSGALVLSPAETIELKYGLRGHLLSAMLGVVSIAMVVTGVAAFLAGIIYSLMGPIHWWNGTQEGNAVRALQSRESGTEAR